MTCRPHSTVGCLAVECTNMGSTEDANALAVIAATPELATPDDTDGFLNAMPIP